MSDASMLCTSRWTPNCFSRERKETPSSQSADHKVFFCWPNNQFWLERKSICAKSSVSSDLWQTSLRARWRCISFGSQRNAVIVSKHAFMPANTRESTLTLNSSLIHWNISKRSEISNWSLGTHGNDRKSVKNGGTYNKTDHNWMLLCIKLSAFIV